MKKLLILAVAFFALLPARMWAEGPLVQKFEGGVFGGFSLPVGGYHGGTAQVGMEIGLDVRYNFTGTPWDCGLMFGLTSAIRDYNNLYNDNFDRWQNNRTLYFAAVSHYNFKQGKKVNPYAGLALGLARNDVVGDNYFPSFGYSMLVAPRVGVEFFHHLRLTGQVNLCRRGYNNFSLTLGITLGGRPKK